MAGDSTIASESLAEIIPKRLGQYLLANIKDPDDDSLLLKDYYDEFPAHHRELKMPSVSIIVSEDTFRALANKQPANTLTDPMTPDGENQIQQDVNWVVGFRDLTLQLDIWARNKEERDDLIESVFNAMNPEISPSGLRLSLSEYFGQICDYLVISRRNSDGEERSQEDEWRSTWEVLASCKAIQTRKEYVIEETIIQETILNTAEPIE